MIIIIVLIVNNDSTHVNTNNNNNSHNNNSSNDNRDVLRGEADDGRAPRVVHLVEVHRELHLRGVLGESRG